MLENEVSDSPTYVSGTVSEKARAGNAHWIKVRGRLTHGQAGQSHREAQCH